MRKLIILLLLAGLGYFVYTHWARWTQWARPFTAVASAVKGPYAIRVLSRNSYYGPYDAGVILVSGNRWRVELKTHGSFLIAVGICDGSKSVSSTPQFPATSLKPGSALTAVLVVGAAAETLPSRTPRVYEQVDGHHCIKLAGINKGVAFQYWIDSTSGFPICTVMKANGLYTETHFVKLPIDFTQPGTEEFFNTAHLTPFFTSYLNP